MPEWVGPVVFGVTFGAGLLSAVLFGIFGKPASSPGDKPVPTTED